MRANLQTAKSYLHFPFIRGKSNCELDKFADFLPCSVTGTDHSLLLALQVFDLFMFLLQLCSKVR